MAASALGMIAFAAAAVDSNKTVRLGAISMLAMSLLAFVPFGAYTIWAQRTYATSMISGRGGIYASEGHAESLSLVSLKINKLTSPSERILCGTPAIYFLSGRDSVTKYYEPHPRVTDTPKIQRIIINDIEKHHMRYFVRSCEWGMDNYFTIEPQNQPKILIDYIEKHYTVKHDYILFKIYERKLPFK